MPFLLLLILILSSCSNSEPPAYYVPTFQSGEYIARKQDEYLFAVLPPQSQPPLPLPWDRQKPNAINKYHFRCKGCFRNPPFSTERQGEKTYVYDCDGSYQHSLPIRDGEEYIYPILIDLLNYIQEQTNSTVIITSGHRCLEHNTYVDPSTVNQTSKHQIGAEVDFYVQGLEQHPHKVLNIIKQYYNTHPTKSTKQEFTQFQRYEKEDAHVRTQPWYNKEVFVKIYQANEGRNKDNTHPYPYLSIQVRWDENTNEKVNYTWQKANSFYRK
jgi:hypothetical protein